MWGLSELSRTGRWPRIEDHITNAFSLTLNKEILPKKELFLILLIPYSIFIVNNLIKNNKVLMLKNKKAADIGKINKDISKSAEDRGGYFFNNNGNPRFWVFYIFLLITIIFSFFPYHAGVLLEILSKLNMKHLLVYGIGSSFIMLIYNVVKYFAYTMFYYIPGLNFKGIRPKFINS